MPGSAHPVSRRTSHPTPAPTPPDRLGFTKPLTSPLVVNHGFALTHTAQLYIFVSRKWPLPPWSSAFASCAPADWHLRVRVPVYRARYADCVSAFLLPRTLPSFSSPGTSDFPPSSTRCPSELLPVSVPIVLGSPRSAVPPVVYRWWLVSPSAPQPIGKAAPPQSACCTLARIHPPLS